MGNSKTTAKPSRPLYAVGANIFAGGFTLGVAKHFTVLAHLEHADRYGAAVAQANFKGLEVFAPDDDAKVLEAWPAKFAKPVDFLYSNPPCAVWSTLGGAAQRGWDWRLDPRLQRVRDVLALVERYRPKVWCWESVCGAFTKGREFVDELVAEAQKQGYSATYTFIDAQWHGISQSRRRFFLVLHRVAIDWTPPKFAAPRAAFDVIKGIAPRRMGGVTPQWDTIFHKVIKNSKPGEPLAKAYDRLFGENYPRNSRGQAKGRFARSARRLGLDGPSGAVVSPWLWHPKEDRQLSIEEFSALTGFPQKFNWLDGGKQRHDPTIRLMARGVMPPVAEWLARNVAQAIQADRPVKTPVTSYADFRRPPGLVAAREVVESGPPLKAPRVPGEPRPPKAPRVKTAPVDYERLVAPAPPRGVPHFETSGEFIRHLVQLGKYSDHEIAAMTRREFLGRVTTASDVSWNRQKLKKENGVDAPRVVRPPLYQQAPPQGRPRTQRPAAR